MKYFGTDGIRARVGQKTMTPEFILQTAKAVGTALNRLQSQQDKPHKTAPRVLIGKDTRISGYLLESCLQAGLTSVGVDVVLGGVIPTAAVAYLTQTLGLDAGIVISGSHNPYYDNGLKFFDAKGGKFDASLEAEIETLIDTPIACHSADQLGKAERLNDSDGRYIEFCKGTFPKKLSLRGLKLVVDCAHGAAYRIAPAVFTELGAEVVSIGTSPDGLNINHEVGATHPDTLVDQVLDRCADYGIALDGDADRLIMVDSKGKIYDGDELLFAIATHQQSMGLPIHTVVGTLMTNLGLEQALSKRNINLVRTAVGDKHILRALKENKWTLGAETSGHILTLNKHTTGDGVIAALQILAAITELGQSLSELTEELTLLPQQMLNIPLRNQGEWKEDSSLLQAIEIAESELENNGRILVRESGTEPLLRVMIESENASLTARLLRLIQTNVTSEKLVA